MRYISRIDQIPQLSEAEKAALRPVAERYAFRVTDEYLNLIDWDDPADPIRQLIIPRVEELNDWGRLDASDEQLNTVTRGVQHKYPDTALLLCNEVCGAYCRYCFRKRLFMDGNEEVEKSVEAGLDYIARHPEISNVLLTGGDPLIMSTRRLSDIIGRLIAERTRYASPNAEAVRQLPESVRNNPIMYPPAEVLEQGEYGADVGAAVTVYAKYWERLKAGD